MRSLVLFAALVLPSCTPDDPADAFVGTWTFHDGTVTTTCTVGSTPTTTMKDLTGSHQVITHGTDADLATTDTSCPIALKVSDDGNLADLVPSDDCIIGDVRSFFRFYRFEQANLTPFGATTALEGLSLRVTAESSSPNGTCQIDGEGFATR